MSQWVVAYCTRPLGDLTGAQLDDLLGSADFWTMAENQGLDESAGEAVADSLRFEPLADHPRVVLVHYRHHELGDTWLRGEHHVDPAFVSEAAHAFDDTDEPPPARARGVLARVIETVAFDLKTSDWAGMGLPVAYQLAMALAKPSLGDGIVEVEGEWWDPKTFARLT